MGIYKIIFYGRNERVNTCTYIYIYICSKGILRENLGRNILGTLQDRVSFTRCGI